MIEPMVERAASPLRIGLATLTLIAGLLLAQPAFGHTLRLLPGHGSPVTAPAAPAVGQAAQTEQGVVQSISARTLVLRELDGAIVTIPIGVQTQIFVDGRPARVEDVKPGFVVVASSFGSELRFVRSS